MLEQCGTCKFAQMVKEDLTQRVCHGGPPQVVIVPTATGPGMAYHWPLVMATGPICSFYKPKFLDINKISE